jgi:tetratricopeptide (TPR) repeat protein
MSSEPDPNDGSKKQKAETFFQYGNDAALKGNYDYAIQMYREACKLAPDILKYRQALRGTERRKFDNEPSKVGRLVGAKTQAIKLKSKAARAKSQWTHVIEVSEDVFVHNPWDVGAARDAAEAAEALNLNLLAQWFVESVLNTANDADFFRYAARIFTLNSAWPQAVAAWEKVKKLYPNDEDARREINAISASATIQRSGLGDALTKRDAAREAEAKAGNEKLEELKQPQLSPEDRWKKEIKENPTQVGPYLQYADHFKLRGDLDSAEKILSRGLSAVADDPALKMAHSEVQIGRLQRKIASQTQKCKERPDDPDAKATLEKVQTMLMDYEIKEYRRRISLHPLDFGLQYELGVRLARAGNHKEAINAFQQARKSTAHQVEALHRMGLSFEIEGALKLAERSFQDALKVADPHDPAICNALHYRLGRVAEALGNNQIAEEHYNEVAANDYGYEDVAQRLRNLGS